MVDYYEYSTPELIRLMGSRFKEYRLRANMTQKEVAERSNLTIPTIHKFENGTAANISFGTFLLLLRAIGCLEQIDNVLPELPESPYLYNKGNKKIQRIRHNNK